MITTFKDKLRLYKLISRNNKLEAKRNPMFGQNRFAKVFSWIMAIFWIGYFIVIGVMLATLFSGIHPTMASYHMMNRGIIYLLSIDFLMRLAFQHTPAQEVKPYSLLPIKRKDIIGCSIANSILSTNNLIWLFMLVPFALVAISPYLGLMATLGFCAGWWLLFVMNSQFYTICRTLYAITIFAWAIPILLVATVLCFTFIPDRDLSGMVFQMLGKGFVMWNPISYIIVIAAIAALVYINVSLQDKVIYKELSKQNQIKLAKVSEYSWLNRFGEIGEYIKLDLKSSIRCKTIRLQNISALVLSLMFAGFMCNSAIGGTMGIFYIVYALTIFGIMGLAPILSIEGNYMDGLISRKESILSCIRAKYYFTSIKTLIPFGFLLIPVALGNLDIYRLIGLTLFTLGPIYAILCCNAILNKQCAPLFTKMTGRNAKTSFVQFIFMAAAWGLPMLLDNLMRNFFDNTIIEMIILGSLGIVTIATSNIWTKIIYKQFCKRKYINMEGFRATIINE
ncbi:MAG: hypothetical protein IKR18_03955 [Bacteroidaceae bacterium]|nr:hypothetical protein [Bacteroidaceae bacterium]